MKQAFVALVFVLSGMCLHAQKDTFDLVTYIPPKDSTGISWQKEIKENTTSYTITSKKTNSWCQIIIVKSTISKGSIEQDFKSEWQGLVVKSYKPTEGPQLNEVQETEGWKIKAGGGKFIFNNGDAMVLLTTATGYDRCVSIVATANTQDYIKDIEALLSSVDLIKLETNVQQTAAKANAAVIGTWGIGTTIASSYNMRITEGSIITQYIFNADGTYSFYIKTFRYQLDKLLLTKETGTYQISGNNLTVNPQKAVIESWSKKDGTDNWGELISSQKKDLEKTTYQFFTQDFGSGMVLVLKANNVTKRDGRFNNSSSDAWFYPSSSKAEEIKLPE